MPDPDEPVMTAASHRCGRCRKTFTLGTDDAAADWWVCDPCRAALIPGTVR
jgi:hypothetical protein